MRFLWLLITPCLLRLSPSLSQPHTATMVAIPFKLLNGQTFMVEADPSFTILQVKQQVEVGVILRAGARTSTAGLICGCVCEHVGRLQANHGVPVAKQTMIFAGRKLRDDATIVDLGIVSETGAYSGKPMRLFSVPD